MRPRQLHIWSQRDSSIPLSSSDCSPMATAPPNARLLGPKASKSERALCVTCLYLDSNGVLYMLHVRNDDSGLCAFRTMLSTHVDRLWLAPLDDVSPSGSHSSSSFCQFAIFQGTHERFWAQFKLASFGGQAVVSSSSSGSSGCGSSGSGSSSSGGGSSSDFCLRMQLLTFGSAGMYLWADSAGSSPVVSHKIMAFDREVWPLGVEWSQNMIVGVSQHSKRQRERDCM